jgi:glycosyltransferase involved in cell wall biosynthesis
MIRSAHLMAGAAQGGAELFYERLCIGLAGAGDAELPLIRRDAARAARLRDAGLCPGQFGFGGKLDVLTRPRLAAAMRAFEPRVAVAWMGRAARHAPAGPWVLVGRLGGYYDLRQFALCDHLVGNTQGVVDWIIGQGFPAARVHLLENFSPDYAGAAPAVLPVPAGARIVLAMGRLHRNKGFDVLLAALARLPGVHGVIAGEGAEREALERLAAQAGIGERVHFLGWRDDMAALLAACDVLACPSRSEPLGNVILEAFSAGKPVVAAMAAGPLELIDSGRSGILVPLESGVGLAAGIEGVLNNAAAARAMGETGRRVYEARFSEAAVVGQWRGFLSTVEKI